MVCVDAKPTAAPLRAENATNHSDGNPPNLTRAAIAPTRISSRKANAMLLAAFGARRTRLANLFRYLVITLSKTTATATMIIIEIIVDHSMPKKVEP
jgi:hypothetical protein